MFFGLTSPCTRAARVPLRPRRGPSAPRGRDAPRRREQVGLQPQGAKNSASVGNSGGEVGPGRRPGGCRRDAAPRRARSPGRPVRRAAGSSTAGSPRPAGTPSPARRVADAARAGAACSPGRPRRRRASSVPVEVALDRRLPVGGHAQAGQGARLAQTSPRAVVTRQMSEDTPPVSGSPLRASAAPARPELAQRPGHRLGQRRDSACSAGMSAALERFDRGVQQAFNGVGTPSSAAPGDESAEVVDPLGLWRARSCAVDDSCAGIATAMRCIADRRVELESDAFDAGQRDDRAMTPSCASTIAGSAASWPLGRPRRPRSRCRRS